MGDYPTELTTGSIYSRHERWPGNWMKTRGGRRNRRSLARVIGVYYRGSLTGDEPVAYSDSLRRGEMLRHVARPDNGERR
jgi:ABC-type thiamine transport system ATPase subunit